MKSSTPLHSVVFQLTPTRTRFELVVYASGRKEKVASGLFSPFLAHLKTAKDQIAKGGYSVVLEPEPGSAAWWFTKDTLERFVRFVSTPEILERVHTLESEILQIEKAITVQRNNDMKLNTVENQLTPKQSIKGKKTPTDSDVDKSIVLYMPDSHLSESNGLTAEEENPKVQLMKLLVTRRNLLQKEQEMAFARAVAAGFDVDHLKLLMSFAERFGAVRLMDACVRFKKLWEKKHETGPLITNEAISSQLDLTATNTSGVSHSTALNQQRLETPENNGKAECKAPVDQQIPQGNHEYFKGHFPRPMFPPWQVHSQPGSATVFQAYSRHCIPYYQNYPETSSSIQPMYISPNIFKHSDGQINNNGIETETWDGYKMRINSAYAEEPDKETSGSREPGEKGSQVGNYRSGLGGSQKVWEVETSLHRVTESASGCKFEDYDGDPSAYKSNRRSSKREGRNKIQDKMTSSMKEGASYSEADGGHWDTFQGLLLKGVNEAEFSVSKGTFAGEKDGQVRRYQSMEGDDPKGGQSPRGRTLDIEVAEMSARSGAYRRITNDGFIVDRQEQCTSASFDPMDVTKPQLSNHDKGRSLHNTDDDSCITMTRSNSLVQTRIDGRKAVDMDFEFQTTAQSAGKLAHRARVQARYEPDDLSLIPEHNTGKDGYDPMLEYRPQLHLEAVTSFDKKGKEGEMDRKASRMLDQKSKLAPDNSHKKKTVVPKRKGGALKLSPPEEARAREEKLRVFKADLQKLRKEKEEKEIKRLEALKVERQKRIAARSTAGPVVSATSQLRRQMPNKLSPSSYNRSKFSDSEPGPMSPLQRTPIRIISSPSSDAIKASKSSKLNASSPSAGNTLSQSVSSFQESKRYNHDITTDTKVAVALIRRLSEPTVSSHHRDSQPLLSESRKHLPTKALPVSHKGSKFSDSEPVCLSPIRKFPIRTVSAESVGCMEASDPSKLNTRSHSTGKTMSHSALPFPKKDISYLTANSKALASHIRRLSEPKIGSSQLVSPVTPHSAPPLRKRDVSNLTADKKASTSQIRRLSEPKIGSSQLVSSVKKQKAEPVTKPIFLSGPQSKKISAIMNHDRIKTSTLQALKTRTAKMPEAAQAKPAGKEVPLRVDKGKTVIASENDDSKRKIGKVLHGSSDDNMVAEKTIVVVECEKPSAATGETTGETTSNETLGLQKDVSAPVMDNHRVCAPVSEADRGPTESIKQEQSNASEVSAEGRINIRKGSPKHSSAYQASISLLLNSEEERTENLKYGEAPSTSFQTSTTGSRTLRSHLSEPESLNLETIPEASNKNPPKGFKRLLRFGKKSHYKGEHKCESDNSSAHSEGPRNSACSGEVCTLKNLLSQDETLAAVSTPQKASRLFSLLSPFRSKNRIKKEAP